MIQPLMLAVMPIALCAAGPDRDGPVRADSLRQVYESGQTWETFYEKADRRRELWVRNWTQSVIPEPLAQRARAAGPWRVLIITEASCSDSANSVPYIAKLVAQTAGLELRLVSSATGRPWMEAHRTPDGRAATPTVLVLDEEFRIRGCWIEQPAELQKFWLPVVARGTMSQEVGEKLAWYAQDEGRETLREFVEVLEGARDGNVICRG